MLENLKLVLIHTWDIDMDKIITNNDYAKRDKIATGRAWVSGIAQKRGMPFRETFAPPGRDVQARIDASRWICDCECGGAESVNPDDPFFYCLSCGNKQTGGLLRRVIFPDNRIEIENAMLQRKIIQPEGRDPIARLVWGVPETLPRNWNPGEEV